MNRVLIVASTALFLFLTSCGKQEGATKPGKKSNFTIKGEFSVPDPTPVKLYYFGASKSELIDSINTKGTNFEFTEPIENPGIYLLRFFNDQDIYLILKPKDKIEVQIDNSLPEISYYVENSFESRRIKTLMDKYNFAMRELNQIYEDFKENPGDLTLRHRIDSARSNIFRDFKRFAFNFIHKEPSSLANILALHFKMGIDQSLFDKYDDFNLYRFVDSCLVIAYPTAIPVQVLNKDVNEIKLQIEDKKYISKIVKAGNLIPPMNAVTIQGDSVSVTDNPGKPVLLYFWASWNPYSVDELLELDKYYRASKAQKIKIVTISLDSRKSELDRFMAEHELKLPVVCDYQYWDSELVARYTIKHVPSTLLTSKEGTITAKDLFGKELFQNLDNLAGN